MNEYLLFWSIIAHKKRCSLVGFILIYNIKRICQKYEKFCLSVSTMVNDNGNDNNLFGK